MADRRALSLGSTSDMMYTCCAVTMAQTCCGRWVVCSAGIGRRHAGSVAAVLSAAKLMESWAAAAVSNIASSGHADRIGGQGCQAKSEAAVAWR